MIIGIAGTDGAGKGTVVDYLVNEKGFTHYSARDVLTSELTKQGRGLTRNDMRLMGNEMRARHGDDFVVTYYLKKIEEDRTEYAVVESIRAVAEAKTLQAQGGILLAVDADQKLRYARVQKRRSSSDQVTFEQFVEHEKLEMDDPDPHGMQKQKVIEMADFVIENNGSLEELHSRIDDFLPKFQPRVIPKSAWLCIKDRKVLFARSYNNEEIFYLPGGKREEGEDDIQALIREIKEETSVDLNPDSVQFVQSFAHHAHGKPKNVTVEVHAYFAEYREEIKAADEIVELAWMDSNDIDRLYGVGVLAVNWLKERDLID